jgi:Peptidase inhibitor family I36
MQRPWVRALAGGLLISAVLGGSTNAGGLTARLGDEVIRLDQAGALSCHDFDFPVLRCFTSPEALERDVLERVSTNTAPAAVVDTGYVTVWEHASYDGARMTLSSDQPWLSSIGWNDRISSFKSFGASGRFLENSPGSGLVYFFNSGAQVSYLSNTYNDKFSAFYID